MTEPEIQQAAAYQVHEPGQQDDGKYDQYDPYKEHHDARNGMPGYGPSSHCRQLPAGA